MTKAKKVVKKEEVVEEVVVESKFRCDNCEDSGKDCYVCSK